MRQAATASRVYHQDIRPTLEPREQFVRDELQRFFDRKRYWPTASELLAFIQAGYRALRIDINGVRPRLTEMEKIGVVRHGVERKCDQSGKTCLTWMPSSPQPPKQQPLFAEVRP